jgi:acyl-CoA synthetase (AMP-forming)/AMP-acid ligase II
MTVTPNSAVGLLAAAAERSGAHPAIRDGDLELSYAELAERVTEFGAGLVEAGVGWGDRVAIWAPNGAPWIIAAFGIWSAGGVLVPVNTRFKPIEVLPLLRRTQARAIVGATEVAGTDLLGSLSDEELGHLTIRVAVDAVGRDGETGWDELLGAAGQRSRSELRRRIGLLDAATPSDILFTSGTTGVPKGVVQTHGRTVAIATDWVAMTGLRSSDRYLMINPYFHMFGLKAGILASVAAGATMYPEPAFDAGRALTRIAAEGITVLPGAPTIYQSLLDHPARARHDLSTLRVAVTGAADIPVELIRRIFAELPFSVVVTGYGLTEGGTVSSTSPDDLAEIIASTVGRPRPGVELRIVDPAGDELPVGEAGEIIVRSPTVMSHYLDDEAATAEVLSSDGWLRTGDLGVIDGDGLLHIVGRVKDMYIVGGFNAYPAEIENLLLAHPDISQVAVIGIPDARLGEVGMAFVVPRRGAELSPEEIIEWSRAHMANYKAPRRVEILDALPTGATGKVLKEDLRARVGIR